MKKLGSSSGDCEDPGFTLPEHIELGLSSQQSSEAIAAHFSAISQEYPALKIDMLPERVQRILCQPNGTQICNLIEPHEVCLNMKTAKKTKSTVPGDIPPKILKEFLPELAGPVSSIMNSISETGKYPKNWKKEYTTAIPKEIPPSSENSNISFRP